jgi:hypothetical protein
VMNAHVSVVELLKNVDIVVYLRLEVFLGRFKGGDEEF